MRSRWLLLLLGFFSLQAFAGDVSVTGAWLRLLPGNLPLAGYAHVTNNTGHALTLVAASSMEFSQVQLHRSVIRDGTDVMQRLNVIHIGVGQTLDFAPGGYHLMLLDRRHPLHTGQRVPVTLRFSDGTHCTAEFIVKGATGT
jgi:periplasmic copper chaperone A